MALRPAARDRAAMGRGRRFGIALQVGAAVALAFAAAWLATAVAAWPALRWRVDLTASSENTLDPSTERVLRALPVDVEVDVFFSAPEPPFHVVGLEVQDRMLRLLRLASDQSGGRLTVTQHELSDRTRLAPATQSRRAELGLFAIEPGGLVAISCAGRRQVVRLRGDLADMDPGNSDPRQGQVVPAHVVHFRGEEALLGAILKVAEERSPFVVFTSGHGELDRTSNAERGAALFARELAAQGFRVEGWDGSAGAPLPEAADLLVTVGAAQRFTAGEFAQIAEFVERGGRMLVALAGAGAGELGDEALLARWGIGVLASGIVAAPHPSVTGALQVGIPECAYVAVGFDGMPAQNPITDPLRLAGRRVLLYASRAFARGNPPPGGRVVDLLRTLPEAWLELPLEPGGERYDFAPDARSERGRFTVAIQAAFRPDPARASAPPAEPGSERPEARVVALGSADALANHLFTSNRDFAVNACDWLASREHRVRVAPRSRAPRLLDLSRPEPIARVTLFTAFLLPGLCLALGLATAWRRGRA